MSPATSQSVKTLEKMNRKWSCIVSGCFKIYFCVFRINDAVVGLWFCSLTFVMSRCKAQPEFKIPPVEFGQVIVLHRWGKGNLMV